MQVLLATSANSLLGGYYSSYLLLVVPFIILSFIAQTLVKSTFSKYSQVRSQSAYRGVEAARRLLNEQGLQHVMIERVPGQLSDHYSPREEVLRLSQSTYDSQSIAAIGVAAHEVGHAVQQKENYAPNAIRSALVGPANIGSSFGPYLAMIGLFMGSDTGRLVTMAGIILFSAAVLFYLVTLPVEFNASKRALVLVENSGILSAEEIKDTRKVLQAAALTYVASALTAFMSLLRLILLSRRRES
ncbi:MAG: zinc metallopeptidase [Clostridiaceae bacterium]|nr:zinc metallopeptidase [Clostridiaceae bacterium]